MTNMGRKKTQMKMTRGTNARQAMLPKERSGLFKKASELCTLCAVETALVILSPSGKTLSFFHPDVETSVSKLAPPGKPDCGLTQLTETEHEATLQALKKEYHDLHEQVKVEKKRGMKLKQLMAERQPQGPSWIDTPIEGLNLTELLTLYEMLDELQGKLIKKLQERTAESSAADSATDPAECSSVDPNGHGINPGN